MVMIKRAGDWTAKLIDTLFEQKKRMMQIEELNIQNYDEEDVFNVLHDVYAEIQIKDKMNVNKSKLFPLIT